MREALIDATDLPQIVGRRWSWNDRDDNFAAAVIVASPTEKTPSEHVVLDLATSA